jgi:salicylate hydroxylase
VSSSINGCLLLFLMTSDMVKLQSGTIPMDAMRADPELIDLTTSPDWPVWMGDQCGILGYSIRQGEEFALHVFWQDDKSGLGDVEEGWDVTCGTETLTLGDCEPRIHRMLALMPDALRTKYVIRDYVEDWTDESGRLVLIGEAAHPLLPCSMHGPSLAVEDAVVFGVLFSRLRNYEQIPLLTETYQELRFARCKSVHESELRNSELVTLPPGEARDQRNANMKMAMGVGNDRWDEGQLREQWEEIAGVFGYNARDAAEGWWVSWGALKERSQAMNPLDFKLELEVLRSPVQESTS